MLATGLQMNLGKRDTCCDSGLGIPSTLGRLLHRCTVDGMQYMET